jgi:hypothetical protein
MGIYINKYIRIFVVGWLTGRWEAGDESRDETREKRHVEKGEGGGRHFARSAKIDELFHF